MHSTSARPPIAVQHLCANQCSSESCATVFSAQTSQYRALASVQDRVWPSQRGVRPFQRLRHPSVNSTSSSVQQSSLLSKVHARRLQMSKKTKTKRNRLAVFPLR